MNREERRAEALRELEAAEYPGWTKVAINPLRFEIRTRPMGHWWNRKYYPQIWDNDLYDWYPGAYVGAGCGYEVAQQICNSLNGVKDEQAHEGRCVRG